MFDARRAAVAGGIALGAVALFAALLAVPVRRAADGGRPTAPDFTDRTLDGGTLSLSEYRGKVVLVNFWATWCGPCRVEMPALQAIHDRYGPQGFAVVTVAEDESPPGRSPVQVIQRFVDDYRLSMPVVLDPTGRIQNLFGVRAYPASFLVDREGRIVKSVLGAAAWDQPPYTTEIERLLRER